MRRDLSTLHVVFSEAVHQEDAVCDDRPGGVDRTRRGQQEQADVVRLPGGDHTDDPRNPASLRPPARYSPCVTILPGTVHVSPSCLV